MFRLRAVLAALLLGAPFTTSAAEITRLASSFDEDDPFDLFIDVGFSRTQHRSKIVREQLAPGGGGRGDATELWFRGSDSRLNIDLSIGLYKDLQFSFSLPLVLQQNDNYAFVAGTTEENSTIVNNCLNPNGKLINELCPTTGEGETGLFTVGSDGTTSRRGGLGNMRFGLAYAFFNQRTDPSKPDWIVGLDYEAPTAAQRDPSIDNTLSDERGNVGDRVHKYTFYTALSRHIRKAEPYFRAHYTLPFAGPGIYSNCANQDNNPPTLGHPENCFTGRWNRKQTGIKAPRTMGFLVGSEFTAFESQAKGQKFILDLRVLGNYVTSGRYYNELSAALRKLLATQGYLQVGGQVGVTAKAGEAFSLRASSAFLYNTDHMLTNERLGVDPKRLLSKNLNEVEAARDEVNPNFDFRTDMVSRRFWAGESSVLRLDLSVAFSF